MLSYVRRRFRDILRRSSPMMVHTVRFMVCVLLFLTSVLGSPFDRFAEERRNQPLELLPGCSPAHNPLKTNAIEASIISQQEWNLCSYKVLLGQTSLACTEYGTGFMTPFKTTTSKVVSGSTNNATFIATYLTEYATLPGPTLVTSTQCGGLLHTFSVGELGQGRSPSFMI